MEIRKIDYNKKNIWNSYFWQMNRRVWSIVIWNGAICMFYTMRV